MKNGRAPKVDVQEVVKYLLGNPKVTAEEAGKLFSCSAIRIKQIAYGNGLRRLNFWVLKDKQE